MGQLRDRVIVQSRTWLDGMTQPVPPYDYDYTYPITVYEAVRRSMEDDSTNLLEELESIYRLIAGKQDKIDPGIPGQIMTWTGMAGQIGAMEVAKVINPDPALRSHQKVPSERAIGDSLDTKVPMSSFNAHVNDTAIHITDVERNRWNSMAPLSSLQAHISNTSMHITEAERGRWNAKANQSDFEEHIYNTNNPHNVTAHQVGAYSRREIDEMFANLRESFFNYLNISWDDRTNNATLVEYHPANWNPNYVLAYGDNLPEVPDPTLTYFALRPATNYKENESQDCLIFCKRPGLAWQEVGFQSMKAGDMVIRYPDTKMYVWIQGHFMQLFTDASVGDDPDNGDIIIGGGNSDNMWRPTLTAEGYIIWTKSKETEPPAPMYVKGKDGKTPIKGIDYDDGKDGQGVAIGGNAGDLLVKVSDDNFDTTWKNLLDILGDLVLAGGTLPQGVINWNDIKGKPEWYDELGDNSDGFITQRAATRQFDNVRDQIVQILEKLDGPGGLEALRQDLFDHINDYNNPHRVTPGIIGAVSTATFLEHTQNFNNPHNVTPKQLGLDNVDNTRDIDKPISNPMQEALDQIMQRIGDVTNDVGKFNYVSNISWDTKSTTITFEFRDGTEMDIRLPISDIFQTIYFDDTETELVIVMPDGSENRINIGSLIQVYFGSISDQIQVTIEDNNVIKATIIPGAIGELEITPSVHLRGSPTTLTQPVSDKSTRIATTEFVRGQVIDNLISYETDRPLSANMGRILNQRKVDIDDLMAIINDIGGVQIIDNLDSTNPEAALSANMGRYLDLTKAPRVHTSPNGSTFGRATISLFGHTRASDVDPLMDGTVFKGTDDGYYARADHRHPTDITRAPIHWPDIAHEQFEMTGEPRAVIPPDDSNDNRIATTEWIRRNMTAVYKGWSITAGTSAVKTANLTSTYMDPVPFIRQIGSAVAVTFTNEDRSGDAPTRLDVNDTGPATITFGGRELKNGMLGKNHTHLFVFDGEFWRLINPVPGTGTGPIVLGPGFAEDPDMQPEKIIKVKTGFQGITTHTDNCTVDGDGQVNKIHIGINFEPKVEIPKLVITDTPNAWAAYMPDGTYALLHNPIVLSIDRSSAVVEFTMDRVYPSNTPCQLVYYTNQATMTIEE